MNQSLLMDLADCGSPDSLLQAIFSHYVDLPRPVPVKDLAREVGINDFQELDAGNFEGGLTANAEKTDGVILTRRGAHPRRKRFTIGHELGHFLVRSHHGTQTCSLGDMRETRRDTKYRRQEAEANRFSAGLLMPKPMFVKDLDELGSVDVAHIQTLSGLYNTSMEATANRYVELTSEICAVIFSKDGVIRYARPAREFPPLAVRSQDRLPAHCSTAHRKNGRAGEWEEHPGEVWLSDRPGRPLPAILEQCVVQQNGYRVTLLYIEASALEDTEEKDDLEERWRIGFRR